MAQFNNKDQRKLEELLEEGWMDRLKARGAEALGSVKGVGQQLKGGLQQAAGSALSKAGDWAESDKISKKGQEFAQQGQKSEREGNVSGHNAKVVYLQKNIDKRIRAFANDIKNDIQKLGLDIGNIEFISEINSALNHLKKSVSGATPPPLPQQSNATPPPLPRQETSEPEGDEPEDDDGIDPYTAAKEARKASAKKGAETRRQKQSKTTTNPRKGKVKKDPLAKYAAPEQEEDLDDMFWK